MQNRVETFEDYSVIYLPTGEGVLVDTEDLELLSGYRWRLRKQARGNCYACTYIKTSKGLRNLMMHRLILQPEEGKVSDHINRCGLDNRRSNLRIATKSQNAMNSGMFSHNKSGYRGVRWHPTSQKWQAFMHIDNRLIGLGVFNTKEEAALSRNKAVKEFHGEFAHQNQIDK